MSICEMRNWLKNCTKYSNSSKWKCKVDRMSDNQVIAVYHRLRSVTK